MDKAKQKSAAAFGSVVASAFLTLAKLIVGLATGSLGVLSEAAHSLVDLAAAALTWFAVRFSDRPADQNHPFGHGKMEALSALIETILLFLIAFWIVSEAVDRLFFGAAHQVDVAWYAIGVMVLSILVDFFRSRALKKVAKETGSQALEADALHFTADMASSGVVLLGLGAVMLGFPEADAVAALAVAALVVWLGWGMGRRTIAVLLDAAPEGIAEQVRKLASAVPGVARIERVRARTVGPTIFIEMEISVSHAMTLDQMQETIDAVKQAIRAVLPEADAVIEATPVSLDGETIVDMVQRIAARKGMPTHDLAVRKIGERRKVSFCIAVDADRSIQDAHDEATQLEEAIASELGPNVEVTAHIDPRRRTEIEGEPLSAEEEAALVPVIENAARSVEGIVNIHGVSAQRRKDGYVVQLHCQFPPETTVEEAHDATTEAELKVRNALGGKTLVVFHAEPIGAPLP